MVSETKLHQSLHMTVLLTNEAWSKFFHSRVYNFVAVFFCVKKTWLLKNNIEGHCFKKNLSINPLKKINQSDLRKI